MKIETLNNVNYYIGKTAQENWDLLDKFKKENDNYIWFHLNSFPSGYIIMETTIENLKNLNLDINEYLNYGARLCLDNTKYRNLSNIKIVYTILKKLTKTNKIGEVIICGKRNLITI